MSNTIGYKIKGLERHQFAPELNGIHMLDGRFVRTPGCKDIESACRYMKLTKVSIEKPLNLIERVEKALQDSGYNHGSICEVAKGINTFYLIALLDKDGEQCGSIVVAVYPDRDAAGILVLDKEIKLDMA